MNRLVGKQPAVQAVEEKATEAKARWDAYTSLTQELAAEHEAALIQQQAAMQAAIDDGKRPPQAPVIEPPIPAEEHNRRLVTRAAEERLLAETLLRAVATSGEAITADARKEIDAAVKEAGPHVAALESILGRVRVAQEAAMEVAGARRALTGTRPSNPVERRSATIGDLVDAVSRGRDLMPYERPRVLIDRDPSGVRTLGLQASNTRRTPETGWEPPLPPEPMRVTRRGV